MERANYWASSDVFDVETRNEIKSLLKDNNFKEISDRFYRELEFGTGGLRGVLGSGTAYINRYNVRKATFALGSYLREVHGDKALRVAVSFDSRRMSREFAEEVCSVLAGMSIMALITEDLRPVPMLSYMVRHFECDAGVCITASHNPPEYNGFKVYWATGGQLVPPHDKGVIAHYYKVDKIDSIPMVSFSQGVSAGQIRIVSSELDESYFNSLLPFSLNQGGKADLKIVFTPIHGAGGYPVKKALNLFGFDNVILVPEQSEPDGNFPTVSSPNPESRSALKMAVDLADKVGADLVLGTDPDVDRVGIVVREAGVFKFFNGNQLGSLLVDYVLSSLKSHNKLPANPLVVKTIVTTDLQTDIAKFYGADCEETLTGFKWICDLIDAYETGRLSPAKNYVCGGEESYGFLAGSYVRDKDAVQACCLAAEMVAYHRYHGRSLTDALDMIHLRHGSYLEGLKTITLPGKEGAEKIDEIMAKMRSEPTKVICGQPVRVIKDYMTSKARSFDESGQLVSEDQIQLPVSNVLQYELGDGTKVSARPSGTEPKIKFYVSVRSVVSDRTELRAVESLNQEKLDEVMGFFEQQVSQ